MAVISKGFDWSKEYQKFEISRKGLMAIVLKGFDWVKGKGPMAIVGLWWPVGGSFFIFFLKATDLSTHYSFTCLCIGTPQNGKRITCLHVLGQSIRTQRCRRGYQVLSLLTDHKLILNSL